jgi:PAS domain S-box-containing protein
MLKRIASLEKELEETRLFFNTVFDFGPSPMWISDGKGTCVRLNEALRRTWGVADEDVVGKYNIFDDPVPKEQGFLPLLKRVFDEGQSVSFQIEYDAARFNELTGANRDTKSVIEATVSPIVNSRGDVTHAIIQHKDLTGVKLAEEAKDKAILKMKQAQKIEAIGLLAAGVAHEINQPLTYIKAIFECTLHDLEQQKVDSKALVEECREAVNQVNRISRIINHLRLFGRAHTLSFQTVRLERVLDDTLILMDPMLRLHGIELRRDIQDDVPEISCDPIRFEQVFINLFQNAIDALKPVQKKQINITMVARDDRLILSFNDNGVGIDPAMQDKMFEPFVTTKEVGEGTGLGLSIVYGIIEEHHGDIQYHAEAQGSTFVITLPLS